MRLAVVGGGINGLCVSWEAAKKGADVTLFEKNSIMGATSSASSKLLHGGLRYLETFDFKLVKEALSERNWWIENVPAIVHPLEMHLPVFKSSNRSKLKYNIGLWLYDILAGKKNIHNHRWLNKSLFTCKSRILKSDELIGGFIFYDGQMQDYELGCWVAEQAKNEGVVIKENIGITRFNTQGGIFITNANEEKNLLNYSYLNNYDFVVNTSGSYAEQLLIDSLVEPKFSIDHIRGSHIIIDRSIPNGYLLEVPFDNRIFFVLPYKNQTLIGTTEVRQKLNEEIRCSKLEEEYLVNAYNNYFVQKICKNDIINSFSGLRPLIKSKNDFSKASREYAIQQDDKLVTVFGGKWTTARSLAKHVCDRIGLTRI